MATRDLYIDEDEILFQPMQSTGKKFYISVSLLSVVVISAIIAYIEAQGDTLIDLRVERPSLEERFLEITGKGSGQ